MKKLKKILKIGLILVAVVSIVVAIFSWRSFAQLDAEIEKIREAGDPVSLADLEVGKVAPETNAATYLARITDDAPKLYDEISPHAHSDDFLWRTGLNEDQIAKVKESLNSYPDVFTMLEKAADSEQHAWPFDYSLPKDDLMQSVLDRIAERRMNARLLDCQGRYLASIDQPDEAADSYLQLLRIARLERIDPLIVSFLVDLACEAIAIDELSQLIATSDFKPETHEAIEKELARHDAMENFAYVLKTDRAFGMDSFRSFPNPLGIRNADWKRYLQFMQNQIDLGAISHCETESDIEFPAGGLAAHIVPGIQACREALNRARAKLRCLRILNAIHQKDIQGGEVHVGDLGLPESATTDPYNGKPLLIKSTSDGWIVYSVGRNGSDDGGAIVGNDLDFGVGPPELFSDEE